MHLRFARASATASVRLPASAVERVVRFEPSQPGAGTLIPSIHAGFRPSTSEWPREESNLRSQIRSLPLYPLSYGAGQRTVALDGVGGSEPLAHFRDTNHYRSVSRRPLDRLARLRRSTASLIGERVVGYQSISPMCTNLRVRECAPDPADVRVSIRVFLPVLDHVPENTSAVFANATLRPSGDQLESPTRPAVRRVGSPAIGSRDEEGVIRIELNPCPIR